MDQLIEFITKMFDTSDWPPRWVCGKWSDFHGWLYISSDIMIWLAYFLIPVILIWFIQRKPNLPFLPVFYLFGAFILFCGATHILDALMFWWPSYRLSALVRLATAIVSMLTVFAMIRDLPKVLNLPEYKDDSVQSSLEKQLAEKDANIRQLSTEIEKLKQNQMPS
ncbi:MAG: TMF family protein [Cyclobacteriaceae bacterium]